MEKKLYQAYDEEEAVRIQRTVVPRLIAHLKTYFDDDNSVGDSKDRMNEKKWLLVPADRRELVLADIITNGFSSDILDQEEKEILFNFRNRGYINLWLILSIIEGSKISTFEEVLSRNIESNITVKDSMLEGTLTDYLRDYYDNNSTDALSKIYAACLKAIENIIKNSDLSEQNIIAALDELTASSMDNRKFFWKLFGWEKLKKYMVKI